MEFIIPKSDDNQYIQNLFIKYTISLYV